MRGTKTLVIDDDVDMLALAELVLSATGAEVFTAVNGREGLGEFDVCEPDLVLLDVVMPVLDGWETCRLLRRLSDVPIIFVTALPQEEDVIRGLDCGAVDYVTKPFSPQVLLARARVALGSVDAGSRKRREVLYNDGTLDVDLEARRVRVNGEPVHLTATEYRLLAYLLENAGRVLTYQQILEQIWGWEYRDCVDYVHVCISHLRQKLEQDPRHPHYILNERGVGYCFESQDHWSRGQA